MRRLLSLLFLSLLLAGPVPARAAGLWEAVEALRADQGEVAGSPERRAAVRSLMTEIVRSAATGVLPRDIVPRASQVGLRVARHEDLVIVFSPSSRADGFYAIRTGAGIPDLVLQAPHAWYDLNTGRLAVHLFEAGHGRVLCTNTAHRYRGASPEGLEDPTHADVAHRPDSVFQAATLGVVEGLADPLVVQLHGFGSDHRGLAAVVSSGSVLQDPRWVEQATRGLRTLLENDAPEGGSGVRTGTHVPELAGTTNAQGNALTGRARFLHVELSLPVRRQLLSDASGRSALGDLLDRIAERSP